MPYYEFKKEIEIALDKIESWDVGARVKGWITSSLKGAKNSRPTKALKKCADDGWFGKKRAKEWSALRNKSTHSDKLDGKDFQELINNVNKCLFLFYSLLFMKIEYKNTHFDFASEGWPEKLLIEPSDSNSLRKG